VAIVHSLSPVRVHETSFQSTLFLVNQSSLSNKNSNGIYFV
jgi:hypothetical protein